ncbi:MAG: hypothetical protein ACHQPI_00445 [Thermoanaerobaculia bacterium]
MPFREYVDALADFEEFDRRYFEPDALHSQQLCAFILTLALIYDDLKGLAMAGVFLGEVTPPPEGGRTAARGEVAALQSQALRMIGGLIHELFDLVNDNATLLKEQDFNRILRRCSDEAELAWKRIVSASERQGTKLPDDPVAKALYFVRNKISFHYDPKRLLGGFRTAFSRTREFGDPALSRGDNLQQTRFFFADAAAQACFIQHAGGSDSKALFAWDSPMLTAVHQALFGLVTSFLTYRAEGNPGVDED